MSKKQRRTLVRLIIGAAAFAAALLIPLGGVFRLALFLVPYFVIGGDVLLRALRNIAHGQVFDENFLMAVATVGAFCVGEYPEGVAVMLFYQVGELFQSYAVGRSRQSISALMDIRPDYANVRRGGELVRVDPEEVSVDDLIVVKPGERVPLDGVIAEGSSTLDTAALTGESLPRDAAPGDAVISGCINLSGLLTVRVSRVYGESTVAKILDLVENASSKKAKAENFITRFARWYTPAVVIGAALLAVVPPLVTGGPFSMWIHRALIFLVISCPCALVISVPLSFSAASAGRPNAASLSRAATTSRRSPGPKRSSSTRPAPSPRVPSGSRRYIPTRSPRTGCSSWRRSLRAIQATRSPFRCGPPTGRSPTKPASPAWRRSPAGA